MIAALILQPRFTLGRNLFVLIGAVAILWLCGICRWTARNKKRTSRPSDPFSLVASDAVLSAPLSRRMFSSISPRDYERCSWELQNVAVDGHVGMDEFLVFLEDFSGRSLAFETVEDLPPSLVLLFYTAACTVGEDADCEGQMYPTIPVDLLVETAHGVLNSVCQAIKDVAAVQVALNFEFQVRSVDESDLSAMQIILSGSVEGDALRRKLEKATQEALIEGFGCDLDPGRRALISTVTVGEQNGVASFLPRQLDEDTFEYAPHNVCDYKVQARITKVIESTCLPTMQQDDEGNDECYIVMSHLVATAASLYHHRTAVELRKETVEILKWAFRENKLNSFRS